MKAIQEREDRHGKRGRERTETFLPDSWFLLLLLTKRT